LVEIDESDLRYTRSSERGSGMRADTTTSNHDDKRRAKLGKTFVTEEHAVAGKLFKDQVWVKTSLVR
jgi:hypothetical protein